MPGLVSTAIEAVLRCYSIPGRHGRLRRYAVGHCCDEGKKWMSSTFFSYTIIFVLYALFTFVATWKKSYESSLQSCVVETSLTEFKVILAMLLSTYCGLQGFDVWRAYGDARKPNWPRWHRIPLPGIATTGLRRDGLRGLHQIVFTRTAVSFRRIIVRWHTRAHSMRIELL